jgi:tRNA pseudouridine32 synthase/23S rRNA pseudouridine746 synthase
VHPVLFADSWLVAADKPSGLLSVPGRGADLADCLAARLAEELGPLRVVHRLDRDTSGVILFARDLETQRQLSRQFEERSVEKRYVGVVAGVVAADEGVIDLPLAKDWDHPPRHKVDHDHGRPATTLWRVLARESDRTRLALFPRTGRSHQLRVHLAAVGHPLLGDPLYASPEVLALSPRLLLHAEELACVHPATSERISLRAEPPF